MFSCRHTIVYLSAVVVSFRKTYTEARRTFFVRRQEERITARINANEFNARESKKKDKPKEETAIHGWTDGRTDEEKSCPARR